MQNDCAANIAHRGVSQCASVRRREKETHAWKYQVCIASWFVHHKQQSSLDRPNRNDKGRENQDEHYDKRSFWRQIQVEYATYRILEAKTARNLVGPNDLFINATNRNVPRSAFRNGRACLPLEQAERRIIPGSNSSKRI